MTILIKGFISNKALESNVFGETSIIGELSTFSRTFSKDIHSITDNAYPGIEMSVFKSVRVETEEVTAVPAVYYSLLASFGAWLYETAELSFNSTTKQIDVVAAIQNRYEANVGLVSVEPLITNGNFYIPSRLNLTLAIPGEESVSLVVWVSDNFFRIGYDETEVEIVTPIENVDIFLGNYESVTEALDAIDPIVTHNRVERVIDKKPATMVLPVVVEWVDQTVTDRTVKTVWHAVIHGPAGNDTDLINTKIKEKILSMTTGTESNWRLVMPDVFRITRFMFIPAWNLMAIPGRASNVGIYSPLTKKSELEALFNNIIGVEGEFTLEDWETFSHPYRSLSLLALAGLDNKPQARTLSHLYGDYIAVESTHEDYNRQSKATIDFANMLGDMIREAERFTVGVNLKQGYRVTTFLDQRCIATRLGTTEFLMVAKNQPI